VQTELLSTIGVASFGLGDPLKAIQSHREGLRRGRALFGKTNVWVAASLTELGEGLGHRQDFYIHETEAVLRQALAMRRSLLGVSDPDIARSLAARAGLLHELSPQVRSPGCDRIGVDEVDAAHGEGAQRVESHAGWRRHRDALLSGWYGSGTK